MCTCARAFGLQVKSLLEAGTYLHRPMLQAVLEHIASFSKGTGTMRYNKYLLAVLTFITRCVGLDEADLEAIVEGLGLVMVVYGAEQTPSRIAAEQLAAANAAEAAARKLARQATDAAKAGAAAAAAAREDGGVSGGGAGEASQGGEGGGADAAEADARAGSAEEQSPRAQ